MQSGTSLCLWAISENARELAHATAELLNLTATNSEDLKDKLKTVDYKSVLTMSTLAQNRVKCLQLISLEFLVICFQ